MIDLRVLRFPGLPPYGPRRWVFLAILGHADSDGRSWPSPATIANEAGVKMRTVRMAVSWLADAKYLEVEDRSGGRRRHPTYAINPALHAALWQKKPGIACHVSGENPASHARNPASHAKTLIIGSLQEEHTTPLADSKEKTNGRPLVNKDPKPNAWAIWLEANRQAGLKDPADFGPDTKAGKELAKRITDPDELKKIFAAYLADHDPFLAKQGHALRLLPGRVGAYLNGSTPGHQETEIEAVNRIARELRAARGQKHGQD
jgi:hypothetical protein